MPPVKAGFPRSSRLLKPREFEVSFAQGFRLTQRPIAVVVSALLKTGLIDDYAPGPRLGLAISKKAVAHAVDRNRLKRIIREEFRKVAAGLPTVDLVFYVQPGAGNLSREQLRQSLTQLWTRIIERCKTS